MDEKIEEVIDDSDVEVTPNEEWLPIARFMSETIGDDYHTRLELQQNSVTMEVRTVPVDN